VKGICASSWTITKNHCMMHSQQNVRSHICLCLTGVVHIVIARYDKLFFA